MKLPADPESMRAVNEIQASAVINVTIADNGATLRVLVDNKLTRRRGDRTGQTLI